MPPYNLIHAQFPMNATQEFKKNDQITQSLRDYHPLRLKYSNNN